MTNLTVQNASQLEAISNGVSIRSIDDVSRMSKMFAASGFFADCRDAAQAGVKIMAGQEIGVPPFAAMNGIHIINGKAAVGSGIMAGKLKGSSKYNYRIKTHTSVLCELEVYELIDGKMQSIGISSFSIDDAKRAGVGEKNLGKFPRNMLFARAISNAIRFYAPDLFLGGGAVYTPEELGATVNDDGEIIEVEEVRVEPRKTITPKAVQSAVTQQLNFFRLQVELEGSEVVAIARSLNLPSSSAEMSMEQGLTLVHELLTRFATEGYDIDRASAEKLVTKSIDQTDTDTALWDDFNQSLEAHESDNAA